MRKFAAFDIDGTLIRWQLYHAVVDELAAAGELGPNALDELRSARLRWKKREHKDSYTEYESFLIDRYEQALPNISTKEYDLLVTHVIDKYKDQVYTFTRELIHSLKDQGYVLLAISGSHQELVSAVSHYYGFDDCIGTRYERDRQGFSGKKQAVTRDKASALRKLIKKHNLQVKGSIAVGDSLSDAAMLEIVERPIAFNPDAALFEVARSKGWRIVVERKNVIYEMEPDSGSFVLV